MIPWVWLWWLKDSSDTLPSLGRGSSEASLPPSRENLRISVYFTEPFLITGFTEVVITFGMRKWINVLTPWVGLTLLFLSHWAFLRIEWGRIRGEEKPGIPQPDNRSSHLRGWDTCQVTAFVYASSSTSLQEGLKGTKKKQMIHLQILTSCSQNQFLGSSASVCFHT